MPDKYLEMCRFSRRGPQGHFYGSPIASYEEPGSGSSGIILGVSFPRARASICPCKNIFAKSARSARFHRRI
jgi:hypothetical protein